MLASCHGGAQRSLLPPLVGSRYARAATATASVSQWTSGALYAPSSIAVTWPAVPGAGDLLVVALWNNGQSTGSANTYAAPSGWTLVNQNTSHAYATYQVFTHVVAAGEGTRYAFTPLAAQREQAWIAADIPGGSGIDGSGNSFINSSTAYTTPAVTPAASGDLAIAFNLPMTTSTLAWTNPPLWSLGTGPTSTWHGEALFQALSSTASVSESATLSGAATGFAAIVLIEPAGTQSTTSPSPSPAPSAAPSPTSGGTAPAPSQWTNGSAYAPATIAVSWKTAPFVGDMLVVTFWNNGQSTGAANTYTAPAGWTLADQNSAAYATYEAFTHVVGAGESNNYVFTPQAAQREHVWIGADVTGSSALDRAGDLFVNGTTYTTLSVTPSTSSDLALAFDLPITSSSVTWNNPNTWTLGTGPTPTWHGEALYRMPSSTASISETSTLSSSAPGFAGIVLLSPSGAQSSPTPAPTSSPQAVDWSTFGYDLQRTGYNSNEATIGTGSFGTMHPMWSTLPNTGGYMQGEPVVAMNVNVGGTNRNLLYSGGINGMFFAIDADTGSTVWSKQLGTGSYTCSGSTSPAGWGVEGTAALDRPRSRVYVPDGANKIHALDLATGAEASGWPVSIAPVTGHDFIHDAMNYNPSNGLLYAGTSSTCDLSPWYGRITAINTSTAAIVNTFYPQQGSSGGGVWGVGGASIDPTTNNVFIAAGNADSSAQSSNYAEHIIELSADLSTVIATNYPPNMPVMYDSDFGATPLLFQPVGCPPLAAVVNKSGAFVLYNRTNIAAGPTQMIVMAPTGDIFRGVPSYDPVTNYVYVALPANYGIYQSGVAAFSITASCTLNTTPVWNGLFGVSGDYRSPVTIADGVAYVSGFSDKTTYAFDAATGTKLWSAGLGSNGIVGPIVIDGRLYVGDLGGNIHAWKP